MPRIAIRKCRVCGCHDQQACPGGCWWVGADLCSACVKSAGNSITVGTGWGVRTKLTLYLGTAGAVWAYLTEGSPRNESVVSLLADATQLQHDSRSLIFAGTEIALTQRARRRVVRWLEERGVKVEEIEDDWPF